MGVTSTQAIMPAAAASMVMLMVFVMVLQAGDVRQ